MFFCFRYLSNMPRNRKRKTNRGQTSADVMMQAVKAVGPGNFAQDYNINYRTLSRYCKKIKKKGDSAEVISVGYVKIRQVFSDAEENMLLEYIQRAADIYFGLTPVEIRKLAF